MKEDKILGKLMNLNLKILKNYTGISHFEDKLIENLFEEYYKKYHAPKYIVNIMLILGYISFYLYMIIGLYKPVFLISGSIFFFISILFMILSHFLNYELLDKITNYVQIFLSSINLIFKAIFICIFFNTPTDDNNEDIIRVIIYEFLSTNLLISFILESDVKVYFYFFLQNIGLIIVCIKFSIKDRHYYFDGIISFFVSFIFFLIRKDWDCKLRLIFSEKLKFQIYFNYTYDYLDGLNCFNINILKNKNIYYKDNFADFINCIDKKELLEGNIGGNLKDSQDLFTERKEFLHSKIEDNFILENLDKNSPFIVKNNSFFSFAKNLKFLKKIKITQDENKNDLNKTPNEQDSIIYENKKINKIIQEKCKIKDKEEDSSFTENSKDNSLLDYFINQVETNSLYEQSHDCVLKNVKLKNENISNKHSSINNINKNSKQKNKQKNNISYEKKNTHLKENLNLGCNKSNIENLNFKSKTFLMDRKNENFTNLGIYSLMLRKSKKILYFDIYHKKIYLNKLINNKRPLNKNEFIIDDYFLYNVTDHIQDKLKIIEDNQQKEMLFAKLSHEFKTPLNSIIGLINTILEMNSDINFLDELNIIKNLSNYIVFLISDIIQFSNLQNYENLNLQISEINLEEILIFCFQILNSLICCNKNKKENISTNLMINVNLKEYKIFADELRMKQILLNFISNSVKFTNKGKIYIKCKKVKNLENNILKVSVKDTGIGIKENDQKKLFKDFALLNPEENLKNNFFGSGLGLSICKSLISKMNIDMSIKSEYLKGSKFSLIIPCKKIRKSSNNKESKSKINDSNLENLNNQIIKSKKNFCESNLIIINSPKVKNEDHSNYSSKKFYNFNEINSNSQKNIIIVDDLSKKNRIENKNKSKSIFKMNHSDNEFKSIHKNERDSNSVTTIKRDSFVLGKRFQFYRKKYNNKNFKNFSDSYFSINFSEFPKIIIIDDNEIINNSTKNVIFSIIKEFNIYFDVIQLYDGLEIIKYILNNEEKYNQIKLIITDENMSFMNGSEAILFIRKIEKVKNYQSIKVISVTCFENNSQTKYILNAGADMILSKPINISNLKSFIKNYILKS